MIKHEYERGDLVISTMGHDAGTPLAVLGIEGEYLILANGEERKLSKPKRKKQKHVKWLFVKIDLDGGALNSDGALKKAVYNKIKENGGF